ncbi:hypothetical protein RZZ46_22655 [Citrobacter amalonaticus]|uniref:hypothetical protein n=1 Tax=Citrobacter amalonaticus TaxID=35703 RepID=UPI002933B503|nr:hypothetical protein [Citrobacter amalonaticus]MEB0587515.1 hypothetical protein [Citrobacter amalonaticus]
MARRQILSLSERESLRALPDDELTLTRMAYFSEHDLALISAHRKSNRIPASGKFRRLRPAKVERSKNNLNEWKGLPLDMRLINSCAIMG